MSVESWRWKLPCSLLCTDFCVTIEVDDFACCTVCLLYNVDENLVGKQVWQVFVQTRKLLGSSLDREFYSNHWSVSLLVIESSWLHLEEVHWCSDLLCNVYISTDSSCLGLTISFIDVTLLPDLLAGEIICLIFFDGGDKDVLHMLEFPTWLKFLKGLS